jgi:fumarate reductase subunit D
MTREPVLSAQAIAAAVSAVIMLGLGMAVSLGWMNLNTEQMGTIEKFVGAVLGLAVLVAPQLVAAFWARGKVTPTADPKINGEPAALVPLAQLQAMQMAAMPAAAPKVEND